MTLPLSYKVGPIEIAPATVLAPMAGVTDTVFRRLIRSQGGCGLIMTEFTSSHGIVATAKAAKRPTRRRPRVRSAIYISTPKSILSPRSCLAPIRK